MASLFISSSFPSFLPFTLFTSSHNKCKPLTLTLLQPKSLSLALIGRMALLVSFLFPFSSAIPELPCLLLLSFLFFLPSNVYGTSLTSHSHLCGLTFVHPFINVDGLSYIIIEEKMNPISSLSDKLLQQVQFALLTSCQFFYKLI